MKVIKYTFDDYIADIERLADQIKQSEKKYSAIVGIPRGGIITAVHLSYKLRIALVDWHDIVAVADALQKSMTDILFVDDIIDSGFNIGSMLYEEEDCACLIWNDTKMCNVTPKFYGTKFSKNNSNDSFEFWWNV